VEVSSRDGSGEQVVGGSGGVNITCEKRIRYLSFCKRSRGQVTLTSQVQVEFVHRDNLRVTSSSSSTFDTESRSL